MRVQTVTLFVEQNVMRRAERAIWNVIRGTKIANTEIRNRNEI